MIIITLRQDAYLASAPLRDYRTSPQQSQELSTGPSIHQQLHRVVSWVVTAPYALPLAGSECTVDERPLTDRQTQSEREFVITHYGNGMKFV